MIPTPFCDQPCKKPKWRLPWPSACGRLPPNLPQIPRAFGSSPRMTIPVPETHRNNSTWKPWPRMRRKAAFASTCCPLSPPPNIPLMSRNFGIASFVPLHYSHKETQSLWLPQRGKRMKEPLPPPRRVWMWTMSCDTCKSGK